MDKQNRKRTHNDEIENDVIIKEPAKQYENLNTREYCICKKQLGGEMLQCGRSCCKIGWYHLECLKMRIIPKGNLICDECKKELRMKKMKNDEASKAPFTILPESIIDCSLLPDAKISKQDKAQATKTEKKLRMERRGSCGPETIKTVPHWLKLAKSVIHGRGVFAIKTIEKGVRIIEYNGEIVTKLESDDREKKYKDDGLLAIYFFTIDNDTIIDATLEGNDARFINHSCYPNVYSKVEEIDGKKRMFLYAKRRIPAGSELSVDYQFEFDRAHPRIKCKCGSFCGYLDVLQLIN